VRDEDRVLSRLAAANHFLVGRRELRAAGLSSRQWARRIASGEWRPLMPSVWCHAATPETWELRVRAGSVWLGSRAALAGRAAARWWGLDGFDNTEAVEFVVPRQRRSKGGPAVRTTRDWSREDSAVRNGVRVTTVTRTIIDLAAHGATARELERAIDSGVRLRWTSVPTLTRRMTELACPGRKGIAQLRELLLDSGGESALERRFLQLLRAAHIRRPQTQVSFRANTTRAIRVDFLFETEQLVVEVSGRVGHASDGDRRKDARRRNHLQQLGLVVLEFTTADVIDEPAMVAQTVRKSLARPC
jgi:very-short-patch-repair endonuclease